MNEKISVIIPIYNVEKYLDRCINSVVNQTYSNLEIILVDDGSPDNCPKICDEWAEKDKRIKVIHKENGGLSDARNVGMKIATSEWIAFIDSDDWVHEKYFEILMKNNQCVDIIVGDYRVVSSDIKDYELERVHVHELSLEKAYKNEFIKKMVWGRLYKKDVIGEIIFRDDMIIGEDTIFNMNIFNSCEQLNIRKIDAELYYYYARNDSIMHTYHPNAWLTMCAYYLDNMENARRRDLYLCEAFKTIFLYRYEGKFLEEDTSKEYWLYIRRCFSVLREEKRIKIVKRIYYYVAGISFSVYRVACVVRDRSVLDWERIQKEKYREATRQ